MDELERAGERYRERDASAALTGFWTLRNPAVLHAAQERERAVLRLFDRCGVDLAGARVLDVGCGLGVEFANLLRWGAPVQGLYGIDPMHSRLLAARGRSGATVTRPLATRRSATRPSTMLLTRASAAVRTPSPSRA